MPYEIFKKMLEAEGFRAAYLGRSGATEEPTFGFRTVKPLDILMSTGIKFSSPKITVGKLMHDAGIRERHRLGLSNHDVQPQTELVGFNGNQRFLAHVGPDYLVVSSSGGIISGIHDADFKRIIKQMKEDRIALLPTNDSIGRRRDLPTLMSGKGSYKLSFPKKK
ncbi:MAG: hypothetical protein AABX01_06930 [Candidatus Micrarchaeota archaeon]